MSLFSWIITIFVIGGVLYNFHESAEERGIDLFGGIYRMIRMTLLILAYPFMVMVQRYRNK